MAIRPLSFRATESAGRDPRGGSLDPAIAVDDRGAKPAAVAPDSNWVLGSNAAMRRISKSIERAAEVECTVLVSGETGTGKELWARLLHRSGPRRSKAFIPVNCAALTPTLAESQLFGHEKGAFTGAAGRSLGIFRAAQGGVVFLDEIGEMPPELQPKLLRVLQQREVIPVGATEPVPIDVQIVAATNRDLEQEVEKGAFREDLYYRLNMIELRVPPLRERKEDIPQFIEFFAQKFADRYRLPVWEPSADALAEFCSFQWPGNVRQLEHVIEQAYVLQTEPKVPVRSIAQASSGKLPCLDLAKLRDQAIKEALEITRGHKARAAKLLGVHANTMTRLLKDIGAPDAESGDDSAA
jgi:DNA-binding NtrC family response regulator